MTCIVHNVVMLTRGCTVWSVRWWIVHTEEDCTVYCGGVVCAGRGVRIVWQWVVCAEKGVPSVWQGEACTGWECRAYGERIVCAGEECRMFGSG